MLLCFQGAKGANQPALWAVGFRVKAPVPRRPPHRSVREDFPHTVPRLPKAGGQWQTKQATPRLAHNFAAQQAFRYYGLSWALETGSLIELPQTFPS